MKERLDVLLVKRNLAESQGESQGSDHVREMFSWTDSGKTRQVRHFHREVSIEVKGHTLPYVSRGGLKLEKALASI